LRIAEHGNGNGQHTLHATTVLDYGNVYEALQLEARDGRHDSLLDFGYADQLGVNVKSLATRQILVHGVKLWTVADDVVLQEVLHFHVVEKTRTKRWHDLVWGNKSKQIDILNFESLESIKDCSTCNHFESSSLASAIYAQQAKTVAPWYREADIVYSAYTRTSCLSIYILNERKI
jgi:hypothetical protein